MGSKEVTENGLLNVQLMSASDARSLTAQAPANLFNEAMAKLNAEITRAAKGGRSCTWVPFQGLTDEMEAALLTLGYVVDRNPAHRAVCISWDEPYNT